MHRKQKHRVLVALACGLAIVSTSSTSARIIGEDGRRPLSEEDGQRYLGVGLVKVTTRKAVYGGTGTLVNDPLTVLTAFHNVFHDGTSGPIGQVQAPMRMMQFVVGDTAYAVKSIRPFNRDYGGFVLADENDLAIVTLEKPVAGVQPLALRSLAPDDDGQSLGDVTLVAYDGLAKNVQECSFRAKAGSYPRSADVLVHDCDSEGNASGAPFLDANGAIVALHLGGSPRGSKIPGRPFNARTNFNIARRITIEALQFVASADQTR